MNFKEDIVSTWQVGTTKVFLKGRTEAGLVEFLNMVDKDYDKLLCQY